MGWRMLDDVMDGETKAEQAMLERCTLIRLNTYIGGEGMHYRYSKQHKSTHHVHYIHRVCFGEQ